MKTNKLIYELDKITNGDWIVNQPDSIIRGYIDYYQLRDRKTNTYIDIFTYHHIVQKYKFEYVEKDTFGDSYYKKRYEPLNDDIFNLLTEFLSEYNKEYVREVI